MNNLNKRYKVTGLKILAVGAAIVFVFSMFGTTGTAEAAGLKGNVVSILKIIREALSDAITSQTSLTTQQIKDQLKAGKTLAEIITGAGGSVEKVEAAARITIKTQLDKLVDDGKLTRAHADKLFSRLDKTLGRLVNHKGHSHGKKTTSKFKGAATPAATRITAQ